MRTARKADSFIARPGLNLLAFSLLILSFLSICVLMPWSAYKHELVIDQHIAQRLPYHSVTEGDSTIRVVYTGEGMVGVKQACMFQDGYDRAQDDMSFVQTMAAMNARAQDESSDTNYLVLVDVDHKYVGVFTRNTSKSDWVLTRYLQCSVGAPHSPTPRARFTIHDRGESFVNSFGTCYYYVQFNGDYLFHSTPVDSNGVADDRMGCEVSHGCVRLLRPQAKWFYDHIPEHTAVLLY